MAWNILVARAAQKQLARFPARDREKIGAALRSLEAGPFSGDIVKLEAAGNRWRRRVVNYRIIPRRRGYRDVFVGPIARRLNHVLRFPCMLVTASSARLVLFGEPYSLAYGFPFRHNYSTDDFCSPRDGVQVRRVLVSAATACVEERLQKKARRFLQGLSTDELQYIAEFLGACVLESWGPAACSRSQLADGIAHFDQFRSTPTGCLSDQEHKMILLLEYLCRCKLTHCPLAAPAGRM